MQNDFVKVRRSALYMPCSNERALEKATQLTTDVLLFDLEDAVAPAQKHIARENIVQALQNKHYGNREKIVRINGINTAWGIDDIKALKQCEFDGLLIPKAETIEQINHVLALIDKEIPIWLMIETPKGVLAVETLSMHEKVTVLVMGTNDLAKEMRVQQSDTREEFNYAFGRCVIAAKAFNCDIIDGVYNQLDNEQGLSAVCYQGKMLGFDGKSVIHPKQLAITNQIFSPSAQDIEQAQAIVDAWQADEAKGVIVVNGKLVEALHVQQSQRLLQIAQQITING